MNRLPLIASFVLFLGLCASAAYWGIQFFKPAQRAVVAPPETNQTIPALDAAATLLGGHANAVLASNFQLKGVVVSGTPVESVAIMASNGKPEQAIRANAEVLPGVMVKEVNSQYVLLKEGGVIKRVELPANPKRQLKVGVSGRITNQDLPAMTGSHPSRYLDRPPLHPPPDTAPQSSPAD